MAGVSPTAAPVGLPEGTVVLSTGDVAVPLHGQAALPLPRSADQAYGDPGGLPTLREAIAGGTGAGGTVTVGPDQVTVTPGARLAILAVLHARAAGGAEVLLPGPYWTSYPELIRRAGGVPVVVPGPVGNGDLDVRELERRRSPATTVVVVNSPRNPDGAVTSVSSVRRVVQWAREHGLTLLFDQVYRGVELGPPAPSVVEAMADLPEHCVVVDGLSKSHALAGLRIGWALTGPHLRRDVVAVASHLFGSTCRIAQEMAVQALRTGSTSRQLGAALAGNLEAALGQLADIPGVTCTRPAGGIFLFPDLRGWLADAAPPAARAGVTGWLRERHGLAVVDGAAFGAPGHVRLSFAVPPAQLAEGLRRLRGALGDESAGR